MWLSSKPLSSPRRAENFPPPLTRFLRSNVGSRSRGRSRASPMFVRKKNVAVETQEPSSPKVTCIGQVRIRRSKQAGAKAGRTKNTAKRRCGWIRKTLLCNHSAGKSKPRSCSPVWRRLLVFFQVGYRRKVDFVKDSAKRGSKREETEEDSDPEDEEEEEEEEEEEAKVFVSSSPPKSALLLMRSRSAPYRASSLANRFWGSPLAAEDAVGEKKEQEDIDLCVTDEEGKPTSEAVPSCRDSAAEESEEKLGFCKGFESSSGERSANTSKIEGGLSKRIGGSARPLILTRCKSEPARRTGKLDPESCFWKMRRLRFGEQCPPHVSD